MQYEPSLVPENPEDLPRFLREELAKIAAAGGLGLAASVEFLPAAPGKPREGALYGADGTNWDPGSGQGVYCYYAAAWHFLG